VYDVWREVFEAGHMELADKYLAETYIQHNPTVPTGRAAFVEFFSRFKKPSPIAPQVSAPLVAITAERDLVILIFVRELSDPKDPAKKYTTTWFDMFRSRPARSPSTGIRRSSHRRLPPRRLLAATCVEPKAQGAASSGGRRRRDDQRRHVDVD
jgi:predicted SnoaL-like aldol condensation-catalyzing enzyme